MAREGRETPDPAAASGKPPVSLYERVLLVITEDWFALSHFQPLVCEVRTIAKEVVVVTRSSGRLDELRALGVRVRPLDLRRGSFNPITLSKVIRGLSQVIDEERPD